MGAGGVVFCFLTTSTAASVLSIATWSAGAPRWLRSSGWAGATGPPRGLFSPLASERSRRAYDTIHGAIQPLGLSQNGLDDPNVTGQFICSTREPECVHCTATRGRWRRCRWVESSQRRAPARLPSPGSFSSPIAVTAAAPSPGDRPSSLVPGRRRSSRDVPQMVPTAIPYPRHPRHAAQSIHTVVRPRQLHTLRRQWAACRRKWPACSVPKRHVGIHVGFPFRLSRRISLVASPSRMHHDTIPLSALRQRSQSPRGGVKRKPRASQRRRRAPT